MQNEWWMKPALQKSEAVLLPALERRTYAEYRFSDRFAHAKPVTDAFIPVSDSWQTTEENALSTYVRPRGSMAGRSVLRAAGVSIGPSGRNPCSSRTSRRNGLLQAIRRQSR